MGHIKYHFVVCIQTVDNPGEDTPNRSLILFIGNRDIVDAETKPVLEFR